MVAVPTTGDGHHMTGDDFAVTVGWGRRGEGNAVMPSQGRAVERAFTTEERARIGNDLAPLGDTTVDVHLNSTAFWRNVPGAVWNYKLGGYQVLKKWLSYRERQVLGRALSAEEVRLFADLVRRILAILFATR